MTLYLQLNGLLCEGEELQDDEPCQQQHHDDHRHHEAHPLSEAYSHVETLGVVEDLIGEGVWRCADWCAHTAEVGTYGDGHGKCDASLAVGRQGLEHGCEEGEHHSCGGSIGDEHREYACDEQEAEQHILALLAKRLDEVLGHHHVKTALGCGYGKDETAEEEYNRRVGEAGHDTYGVEQLSILVAIALEELERGVGDAEQQHEDDGYGRCPCRYGFGEPKHYRHDKDCNNTLLNHREAIDAKHT